VEPVVQVVVVAPKQVHKVSEVREHLAKGMQEAPVSQQYLVPVVAAPAQLVTMVDHQPLATVVMVFRHLLLVLQ
jgi:hypothetical protein